MRFILNIAIGIGCAIIAASGGAQAATVGASGSAAVGWSLTGAYDIDGNPVDGTDAVTFTGTSSLNLSANASGSVTRVDSRSAEVFYTVTNTSLDIFIDWFADLQTFSSGGASRPPGLAGDVYYDANAFFTVGDATSFASVTGNYTCTAALCDGYGVGQTQSGTGSGFGRLAPGEFVTFTLTGQVFATQRITNVTAIPLPSSGILLAAGLLAFMTSRRKTTA